jgi:carboxypeptidase Q
MLGLGGSVGTGREEISARVVVVEDKEELDRLGDQVKGKIVVFNVAMPEYDPETGSGYGLVYPYRTNGASWAADHGAVAALVRSTTARSLRTPHTGLMLYNPNKPKIPAAAISVEDAEMLASLYYRGIPTTVRLKMVSGTLGRGSPCSNVIGELRGSTHPEEIVVIGGHIDSWDVGQGAHDDGGGCVIAMEAINVLRKLNMIPRRTIRVVLWTAEEMGLHGAKAYVSHNKEELSRHVAAIESDGGIFQPTGYSVECVDPDRESKAAAQMRDILNLVSAIGLMDVRIGHSGPDVNEMRDAGVVLMGHRVEGSKYFDYHHSQADTLDKVDPFDLTNNVAVLATVAYVIADMPERIGE